MVGAVLPFGRDRRADGAETTIPPSQENGPRQAIRQRERLMSHPSTQPWDPLDLDDAEEIYLGPTAGFPAELSRLALPELQVLHSRLCRQLNRDHLQHPAFPHPVTMARYCKVVFALDARAGVHGSVRPARP
ncbi:hypothetical protein GCM10009696_17990 [Kocuria himachalensis]